MMGREKPIRCHNTMVGHSKNPALHAQVLLPVEPDARVPDWILDRTPAEVKAAYAAALRKREQGQVKVWATPCVLAPAAPPQLKAACAEAALA